MTARIDLNADLGEGLPNDAMMMPFITSCNIACGGHAGDGDSMLATLRAARDHGVAAGAHPGYPDRDGFGRRRIAMGPGELAASLRMQVKALDRLAGDEGMTLRHVKPHGALYNEASTDEGLAALLADVASDCLPGSFLVGPPGSALERAAAARGLRFLREGFMDRLYTAEGGLVPRSMPGAVIEAIPARVEQALALASGLAVTTREQTPLLLQVDTLCLHGDSSNAPATARAVRGALEAAGIEVRHPHAEA